jgi:CelD/BcsL family acetyltransferase involved in cellulose biosynthesis
MLIKTGGFDEAYAEHRVGVYLLMRVIEDACSDPSLRVLDFGPGDTTYKEQFSNRSLEERHAVVFAPTLRARRINVTRTAILVPARAAKQVLDATQLTDRVRGLMRR